MIIIIYHPCNDLTTLPEGERSPGMLIVNEISNQLCRRARGPINGMGLEVGPIMYFDD